MRTLIIDDDNGIRQTLRLALETQGYSVKNCADGKSGLEAVRQESVDLVFLDLKLIQESGLDLLPELLEISPRLIVIIMTAYVSIESAVEAMRRGAYDYLTKPFKPAQVAQVIERVNKTRKLENRVLELPDPDDVQFDSKEPKMQEMLTLAHKAAASSASILILGENGTGKSLLAKYIHTRSSRKEEPIITVSCPNLSKDLLSSELFGHVKGAFTGAVGDTLGKVAAADKGTLFLDEIGELPLEIQPRLLRLLQEKEYERVGETKTRRADVRIISATNRDLKEAVQKGLFREDLLYRLNVITLELPPLRERPLDILSIAEKQLRFCSQQLGKKVTGFTPGAEKNLQSYRWPGNLRELSNIIERAVIVAEGDQIDSGDFPSEIGGSLGSAIELGSEHSLSAIEEEHIRKVLHRTSSIQEAARILGIDPTTLLRKRKKLPV